MIKTFTQKVCKIIISILSVIGAFTLLGFLIFWLSFGNLILSLQSIEQINGTALYTMEYHGNYQFPLFLKTGAATQEELIHFLLDKMSLGLPIETSQFDFGCTTFLSKTQNNHPLFGRNFDMFDAPALLVKTTPSHGYKSISMTSLHIFGFSKEKMPSSLADLILFFGAPYFPLDGINEEGFAISVMQADNSSINQYADKVDITTSTAIRLLLDKAATVQEAIDLLEKYNLHAENHHFMLADASGDSAVIEFIDNEIIILRNHLVCTNFLVSHRDSVYGSGVDRYWTVSDKLDKTGGILNPSEAMDLLQICRWHETPDVSTQWSCVYDLKSKSIDIVMHEDWDNVLHFKLSSFPFF